jgi:hypothetical protein
MEKYNINVFINTVKDDRLEDVVKIFVGESSSKKISNVPITILQNQNYNPDNDQDYNFVKSSIDQAEIDDKNSYTIVCQDSVVSLSKARELYDMIEEAIESTPDFDIFYLANYMDQCEKMTDIKPLGITGTKLVNTVSPSPGSFLCLLFSPSGKRKFNEYFNEKPVPKSSLTSKKTLGNYLNSMTKDGKFKSVTTSPPLIQFNIFTRKNDRELQKVMQCSEPTGSKKLRQDTKKNIEVEIEKTKNNNTNTTFIWFILIIIIILIGAYLLIRYTGVKSEDTSSAFTSPLYNTGPTFINSKPAK